MEYNDVNAMIKMSASAECDLMMTGIDSMFCIYHRFDIRLFMGVTSDICNRRQYPSVDRYTCCSQCI